MSDLIDKEMAIKCLEHAKIHPARDGFAKAHNCGIDTAITTLIMLKEVEADTPQTESTGSPIGDYRDGVGAWQTDCGWK